MSTLCSEFFSPFFMRQDKVKLKLHENFVTFERLFITYKKINRPFYTLNVLTLKLDILYIVDVYARTNKLL